MNLNHFNKQIQSIGDAQMKILVEEEGKKLERIAIRIWRQYLNSYSPSLYAVHLTGGEGVRTGNSERAIKLGKPFRNLDGSFGIELTWVNELVYHNSVMPSQPKGHAVMLISDGWKVKRGNHRNIYRFGYYEGFDYISKVERAYEAEKHRSMSLETHWSGNYLKQ